MVSENENPIPVPIKIEVHNSCFIPFGIQIKIPIRHHRS